MRRSDVPPNSLHLRVEPETANRPSKRRCWAVAAILVPHALPGAQPMIIREEEFNDREAIHDVVSLLYRSALPLGSVKSGIRFRLRHRERPMITRRNFAISLAALPIGLNAITA